MAYCTLAEVLAKVPKLGLDATTTPSTVTVTTWCTEASDDIIDPIIRDIVDLPVTDTTGLKYLKQCAILWVVSQIYFSIEADSEQGTLAYDRFKEMIDSALNRPSLLATTANKRTTGHFTRTVDDEGNVPCRRGERQW